MKLYKIAKYGDMVKQKYLEQGIDTNIIDNYISKFDLIRKRKDKELFADIPNITVPKAQRNDITAYRDFHDLERVVDYIKGQKQIEPTQASTSEATPIYQDNNLSVYKGTTPQECINIRGGYPYTWCVAAQGSNNMYNTYRYKENEPTFYFVKSNNIPVEDKYHFFVIQVDNQNNYIVTSSKNDGDKTMSWSEISKINPALTKLQSLFKNIPLTPKERENYNKFKRGLNENSFAQLSYEDKKMYLDTVGHQALSAGQFKSLPDDLKSHYISFGLGLDYYKSKAIEDNQPLLKRYKQVTERKVDALKDNYGLSFLPSELESLDENKKKILINNLHDLNLDKLITNSSMSKDDKLYEDIARYKDDIDGHIVCSLLTCCNNPENLAKILGQDNINKLSDRNVFHILNNNNSFHLLNNNKEPTKSEMANILGQENINKLSDNSVMNLLGSSSEKDMDELVNIIMSKGNLSSNNIYQVLKSSHNPTDIAEKILQRQGPNLSSSNIANILENRKIDNSNDQFTKKIIQYKGNNLVADDVFHLLTFAHNRQEIAGLMGRNNINKLVEEKSSNELIYPLLVGSGNVIEMANILGHELINKIPSTDIYHLLRLENEEDRKAMQKILVNHPAYQENLDTLKKFHPQTAKSLEQNIASNKYFKIANMNWYKIAGLITPDPNLVKYMTNQVKPYIQTLLTNKRIKELKEDKHTLTQSINYNKEVLRNPEAFKGWRDYPASYLEKLRVELPAEEKKLQELNERLEALLSVPKIKFPPVREGLRKIEINVPDDIIPPNLKELMIAINRPIMKLVMYYGISGAKGTYDKDYDKSSIAINIDLIR